MSCEPHPFDETDDCALMLRAQRGDLDRFGELVRRHERAVVNFFRRMGVYMDAEDLAQETFVRIYRNRARYQPRARFTTYLYRVARSVWVDHVRRRARQERRNDAYEAELEQAEAPSARPGERLDAQAALAALPAKMREVAVMGLCQGMKYRDIAEALDIPEGTVKSRMHLAMQQLKEFFDEHPSD